MTTWIKVARLHLVDRWTYLGVPILILGLFFGLALVIADMVPSTGNGHPGYTAGPVVFYVFFFSLGLLSIVRTLPFALSLGVSRRAFYTGTALLAVGLTAGYGLVWAVLQTIERATGGWGLDMYLFRIRYILDGPWYLTWLTLFVVLSLLFFYGMWYGVVYQRWGLLGTLVFGAGQLVLFVAAALTITKLHGWPAFGRFFLTLSAAGFTGVLAALAAVLLAGGLATVRRVAV